MKTDLVIPIYVDTNALLDILASIEGGFSIVEKVTSRSADTSGIDRAVKAEAGTEFGVPNVLSLLKLTLGYSGNWKKAKEEQQEKEVERYHTYGSLFHRLREYLDTNSLVKRLDENSATWDDIQPSDFVEIHGIFRPNPSANSLEIMERLIRITQIVQDMPPSYKKSSDSTKTKMTTEEKQQLKEEERKTNEEREKVRNQIKQMEQMRKFLQSVLSDIQSEKIRIFVVDLKQPVEYKVVALLFVDYLRDQSMKEISYKEFKLLGKVARKLDESDDKSIDLLVGTGFGGIDKNVLEQLVGGLAHIPNMNFPEVEMEITGPALEIVPIAVFI